VLGVDGGKEVKETNFMSQVEDRISTRQKVMGALSQIIGHPLSGAWRAADMRVFDFGTLRPVERGSVGDFALHIQCPWRIEGKDGIVTGRRDLWEPIELSPDFDWESWDYEKSPNLQDFLVDQWMRKHSLSLIVRKVDADDFGGASIDFDGGFGLRLFPYGTRGEDWRLFRPKTGTPHFVVSGGKVENDKREKPR
jgi:hypothetical protein